MGLLLSREEPGPGLRVSSLPLLDLKGENFFVGDGERLGVSSSGGGVFLNFLGDLEKKFIWKSAEVGPAFLHG